jgi:hypothetical protein
MHRSRNSNVSLNIFQVRQLPSIQCALRPYWNFDQTRNDPEENNIKNNVQNKNIYDMFMYDFSSNLLALKTRHF